MGYLSAGEIISDAAAELGLGTVTDAYGSTDANIIQLRGLFKSAGRDIARVRDWTHLIKEYSFVTRPNWAASTTYTAAGAAWQPNTAYAVDNLASANGSLFRCTAAGTSAAFNFSGPSGLGQTVTDNSVTWKFLNTGSASIVVNGQNAYTCAVGGTSGSTAPYALSTSTGAVSDGACTWSYLGNASDYALPSDFSNLIDQTGWNRTNRLPVGGPVDGQVWQYLKGRAQGVVFNVLFRPVAGVMRLYPDTNTPGGYAITFEYVSNSWVSATGGTAPTTDAPTVNSDIVYLDPLMMVRRIKLDWLKAKGFDTTHAQDEYDEAAEQTMNADGSAPILNLSGRGPYDPLVGAQNVPWTGFGS